MASPPIDDDESVDALFASVGKKLGWFDDDALRRLAAKSTQKKTINMSKHRGATESSLKGKGRKSVRKPHRNSSHTSSCEPDPLVLQQPVPSDTRVPLKELNEGSVAGVTPDSCRVPSPTNRSSRSASVCSPPKLSFSGCGSHSGDSPSDGVLLHEQQQPDLNSSAAASMSRRKLSSAEAECSSSLRSVVPAGTPVGDGVSIPRVQLSFSNCSRESSTPSSNETSPKQAIVCATAATFRTGEASDESVDELFQNIGEQLGWFNDDKLVQLSQKASSTKKIKTKAVRSLRLPKVKTENESFDCSEKHHEAKLPSADGMPDEPQQPIRRVRGHKKVVPGASEFASHSQVPLGKRGRSLEKTTPQHRQSRRTILSSDDDDEDDDKFEAFLAAVRTPSVSERISRTSGGARRSIFVLYSMDHFVVDNDEVEYDSSASPSSLPSPGLNFYSAVNRVIDTSGKKYGGAKRWQQQRRRSTSSENETPDDCSHDEPFDILSDDSSLYDDDQDNVGLSARRQPPTPAVRLPTVVRATPARGSATVQKRTISFLKSLDVNLPEGMARDPSSLKYLTNFRKNRDDLATRLHKLYNETVFDSKLTEVQVIWNKKMLKTAGFCYYTTTADQQRSARIELATKVVDRAERLRDTLLHEMCHAATWVVNQQRQGHGVLWQMWGRLACSVHPDLQVVSRCHSYAIAKEYTYRCTKCSQIYGRHSKSIDIERHRCGICKGMLELTVQDGRRTDATASNGTALQTPKIPSRFAMFVKENYGTIKACGDVKKTHGEVMRALAEAFSQLPSGTGLTNGTARYGDQ